MMNAGTVSVWPVPPSHVSVTCSRPVLPYAFEIQSTLPLAANLSLKSFHLFLKLLDFGLILFRCPVARPPKDDSGE